MSGFPSMNDLYRRLLRAIPRRSSPDDGAPATDARSVRSWAASLPMASFAASTSLLQERLRWMNQARIGPAERLEALEVLREPVAQLSAVAEKQVIGATFPLSPQKAELGSLTEGFQYELAIGYIEALYDLCAPKAAVPMFKSGSAVLAAVRALEHGGACLQKAYLLYHTPPAGVWQALHDIYRVAVDLNIENRPLGGIGMGIGNGQRAQPAYAHALLLALIDPYSYTFRELPEIIEITRILEEYCDLRLFKSVPRDYDGLRLVDTNGDSGPGYMITTGESQREGLIGIDTGRLLAYIEGELAALPESAPTLELRSRNNGTRTVELGLIRSLIASLTAEHARRYERLDSEHALETVIGLHDLHCVLAGNEEFTSFAHRVSGNADSVDVGDSVASWAMAVNEHARVLRPSASVLDQSLRGYRLMWDCGPGGETVRAKVGEVVGLRLISDGTSANWMVGTIRWMRIDDLGKVEAGIELLSRRAFPVATRAIDKNTKLAPAKPPVRGILLAPLRSGDSGAYTTLLAPALLDAATSRIEIASPQDPARWWADAGVRRVDAAGDLDRAGTYVHFRVPSLRAAEGGRGQDHAARVAGTAAF